LLARLRPCWHIAAVDLIGIPARFGSTRFPAKPLATIAGRTLIARVLRNARRAAAALPGTIVRVMTDDPRIADHVIAQGGQAILTDPGLASGTDRVLAGARLLPTMPDLIVNLQGDALFVTPAIIRSLLVALRASDFAVATPVVPLDWNALDRFRAAKRETPFTGSTCIRGPDGAALWFSKQVLPAIRDEAAMRVSTSCSPVLQHVGLYAFRAAAMARFAASSPGHYERIEGLEQLRLIERGERILTVEIPPRPWPLSGIDTPQDAARAERLIGEYGDPWDDRDA